MSSYDNIVMLDSQLCKILYKTVPKWGRRAGSEAGNISLELRNRLPVVDLTQIISV